MKVSDYLVVPIRLDALVCPAPKAIRGPTADFSTLPYWKKDLADGMDARDHNSNHPFLTQAVARQPFSEAGLNLDAGTHLHWALPDTLTHGRAQDDGGLEMPTAPNRWLVSRTCGGSTVQWIVESDYLRDPALDDVDGELFSAGVVYPAFPMGKHASASAALTESGERPWRHMGRAIALDKGGWQEPNLPDSTTSTPTQYLDGLTGQKLTAMGWGDPLFAALYPNCFSVFGFHDQEIPSQDVTYDVIGWFSNPDDDILSANTNSDASSILTDALSRTRLKYGKTDPNSKPISEATIWARALEEVFKWQTHEWRPGGLSAHDVDIAPVTRTLFAGSLHLTAEAAKKNEPDIPKTTFSLGHCDGESISVWLANAWQPESGDWDKTKVEDQLEAVQLSHNLSHKEIDVGFAFKEARHSRGFEPTSGGLVWGVRPSSKDKSDTPPDLTAPDMDIDSALLLQELNLLQDRLNQQRNQLVSLRKNLHSDWHMYQIATHPDSIDDSPYPEAEKMAAYMEKGSLPSIRNLRSDIEACSADIEHKKELLNAALPEAYECYHRNAPSYWKPNDPALLMSGNGLQSSPRHGMDGVLSCWLHSSDKEPEAFDPIALWRSLHREIPRQNWSSDYHALAFEWGIDVKSLAQTDQASDQLIGQFSLSDNGLESVDLISKLSEPLLKEAAGHYSGQSLLSDHVGSAFRQKLATWVLTHAKELPLRNALEAFARGGATATHPAMDALEIQHAAVRRTVVEGLRDAAPLHDIQRAWIEVAGWNIPPSAGNEFVNNLSHCPVAEDDLLPASNEFFATACQLLEFLTSEDAPSLHTQALSGMHDSFLCQQQIFQLPVADPLGFPDQKALALEVAQALLGERLSSPMPYDNFMPLRAGNMRLDKLDIIDSFGRTIPIKQDGDTGLTKVMNAAGYRQNHTPDGWTWLPPRLTQAARIDLRWLSSVSETVEVNDHPLTSPVCGWLTPNLIDRSIQVHDCDGAILGMLIEDGSGGIAWQLAPGADLVVVPDLFEDRTLRDVVKWIMDPARGNGFLASMLDTLESSLEGIHPEGLHTHESLSLLIGQPLAVVRASLKINLEGLPAAATDWDSFKYNLERSRLSDEVIKGALLKVSMGLDEAVRSLNETGAEAATQPWAIAGAILSNLQSIVRRYEKLAVGLKDQDHLKQMLDEIALKLDRAPKKDALPLARELLNELAQLHHEVDRQARQILSGIDRITGGFERMKFPVQLGYWQKLNDGLAGYWACSPAGSLEDTFVALHAKTPKKTLISEAIRNSSEGPNTLELAPADAALQVVMLMDPRGPVHASSGFLPVKSLSVPNAHFDNVLSRLEAFFMNAPVLTPQAHLALNLPQVPDASWAWLESDRNGHFDSQTKIKSPSPGGEFAPKLRLAEGWLRLDPSKK